MSRWKGSVFVISLALVFPLLAFCAWQQHALLSYLRLSAFRVACAAPLYLLVLRNIVYPYFTSPLNDLPYPPGESFVLAHTRALITRPPGAVFLKWATTIPNQGLIFFRTFLHSNPVLLLTSPEALVDVLLTRAYDYEKPTGGRRFLSGVLGKGLIVVEGPEHKFQRKAVAPAFQGKHINGLVPLFWEKALELVAVLATEAQRGPVEIGGHVSRATLDIIGSAGCGRDFRSLHNSDDEMAQLYSRILDARRPPLPVYFLLNAFVPRAIVRNIPIARYNRRARAADGLRVVCRRLIAEKRVSMAADDAAHVDILAVLIRSGSFDDEGLVDQLLTFFAAGHETTSNALTWACYLLTQHPRVQDRLRAELRAHIRLDDGAAAAASSPVDMATLDALPYLQAVCQEVLRFYPTVPITARKAVRDTTILGRVVPRGTEVIVCPWAVNRSPLLWGPDAGEFRPERWLPDGRTDGDGECEGGGKGGAKGEGGAMGEDKKKTMSGGGGVHGGAGSAHAFITFLHGPRSCIGSRFAQAELRCFVAALVLRFGIELADPARDFTPVGLVAIKPKDGMLLRLTRL